MHKLLVYIHQNKYKILMIIGAIIIFLLTIHGLNTIVVNQSKNMSQNLSNISNKSKVSNSSSNSSTTITENIGFSISDNISKGEILQSEKRVIQSFLTYCNEGKIESAYRLISNDCKNELYNTLEIFKDSYYQKNFKSKMTFNIESWDRNVYKISMTEDSLSTGKISNNNYKKQEFITVIEENQKYRLNINNYIGNFDIDKGTENSGINIRIKDKKVYKEYEQYTVVISNNTKNNIILNELKDLRTIYIENENSIKYNASINEIPSSFMNIKQNEIKEVDIKFYRNYSSSVRITSFNFCDIILNSDDLENSERLNVYVIL